MPTGSFLWRFMYRFSGVEKLLSLGIYPDVRLKAARERPDEARRLVAAGADPSVKRQVEKNARANRFAAVPGRVAGKQARNSFGEHLVTRPRSACEDGWIGLMSCLKKKDVQTCRPQATAHSVGCNFY